MECAPVHEVEYVPDEEVVVSVKRRRQEEEVDVEVSNDKSEKGLLQRCRDIGANLESVTEAEKERRKCRWLSLWP